MSGVTTKKLSPLDQDQPKHPQLATPIFNRGHQREIPEILQSGHISAPCAKIKKIKGTLFPSTFKV